MPLLPARATLERVRYPGLPHLKTHPTIMGAFAALCGRPAPVFRTCRVLEIGCGEGINLLSMALGAPGSEFVGFDLAEADITRARETAKAAGIENVAFHVADIRNPEPVEGSFDYVIAHGVYAWVPADVRAALMTLVGRILASGGVALISYNAHPGCRIRQAIRDILLEALSGIADPAERMDEAREVLWDQIGRWSGADPLHEALIQDARDMLKRPAEVLLYDELHEDWEPQTLTQVVAAAKASGLDYLCDGSQGLLAEAFFPLDRFEAARRRTQGDWVRFEQWLDFTDMRRFRWSMFGRGGGPILRSVASARLEGLHAAADLQPAGPGLEGKAYNFTSRGGAEFATDDPRLNQLFQRLADAFPASIPLDQAVRDPILAEVVLSLFVHNVLSLSTQPFPFTLEPGERPFASPLARVQAARGESLLAGLHHRPVHLPDPLSPRFLMLLDGTRTRADLVREAATMTAVAEGQAAEHVSRELARFAELGLLGSLTLRTRLDRHS